MCVLVLFTFIYTPVTGLRPRTAAELLSEPLLGGLERGSVLNLSIISPYRAAADWWPGGSEESGTPVGSSDLCPLPPAVTVPADTIAPQWKFNQEIDPHEERPLSC